MTEAAKKTPRDATEFEREQLRFFLLRGDLVGTLTEINPSLAWLSLLGEMQLVNRDTPLAPWIERNFDSVEAVQEVAANIQSFTPETADVLEFRLNRKLSSLSPLLVQCWRLIFRHIRTAKQRGLQSDWFDIEPRIRRGDLSPEVQERFTQALRPKLQIGKRSSLYDRDRTTAPERPSDLMAIDFEVEDGLTEEEVLSAWPAKTAPAIEARVLQELTHALSAAIEDAIDAGVESNRGYSTSDSDVPSVAEHGQNLYRSGFFAIVRVVAELWTRLLRKDAALALPFVALWQQSESRLMRRLALFAAADPAVPASVAADILKTLPLGEFFLTNSAVEVYRLIRSRWEHFGVADREVIERRITEGPPADWFKEGSEKQRLIDRARFDFLGEMERAGLTLGQQARAVLEEVRTGWPQWELRPAEQAGFHIWTGGARDIVGDPAKLGDISDDKLVSAAKKAAETADFMEGDAWQALCQTEPLRALRGLAAEADKGLWPAWAWRPFLWAAPKIEDLNAPAAIAQLLLRWPLPSFEEIADTASWWINEKAAVLDESLLWPLWDRIADAVPRTADEEAADDE
ncbi:hypothetical protein RA307_29050 [Xanthobacteraceae bacterium Astr-EGSB]|uniref:hypothetical protein n=1 Tax=Astrobacterium formosum TaxID=3069710 RepID=UPI0027B01625|nr:hypothetical protein [Xanthobacteraceae bacterium Astr-EGSB]